jgi:hypothetical protein
MGVGGGGSDDGGGDGGTGGGRGGAWAPELRAICRSAEWFPGILAQWRSGQNYGGCRHKYRLCAVSDAISALREYARRCRAANGWVCASSA